MQSDKKQINREEIRHHFKEAAEVGEALEQIRERQLSQIDLDAIILNEINSSNVEQFTGLINSGILSYEEIFNRINQKDSPLRDNLIVKFLWFFSGARSEDYVEIVSLINSIDYKLLETKYLINLAKIVGKANIPETFFDATSYLFEIYKLSTTIIDQEDPSKYPFSKISSAVFATLPHSSDKVEFIKSNFMIVEDLALYQHAARASDTHELAFYMFDKYLDLDPELDNPLLGKFADTLDIGLRKCPVKVLEDRAEQLLKILQNKPAILRKFKDALDTIISRGIFEGSYIANKTLNVVKQLATENPDLVKTLNLLQKIVDEPGRNVFTAIESMRVIELDEEYEFKNLDESANYLHDTLEITLENSRIVVSAVTFLLRNGYIDIVLDFLDKVDDVSKDFVIHNVRFLKLVNGNESLLKAFDSLIRKFFPDPENNLDGYENNLREGFLNEVKHQINNVELFENIQSLISSSLESLSFVELKFLTLLVRKHGVLSENFINFITKKNPMLNISKTGSELYVENSRNIGVISHKRMGVEQVHHWFNMYSNGAPVERILKVEFNAQTNSYDVDSAYMGASLADVIKILNLRNQGSRQLQLAEQGIFRTTASPKSLLEDVELIIYAYGYRDPLIAQIKEGVEKANSAMVELGVDPVHLHAGNYVVFLAEYNYIQQHLNSGRAVVEVNGEKTQVPATEQNILPLKKYVSFNPIDFYRYPDRFKAITSYIDFDLAKQIEEPQTA
jgi:hypothetical protein